MSIIEDAYLEYISSISTEKQEKTQDNSVQYKVLEFIVNHVSKDKNNTYKLEINSPSHKNIINDIILIGRSLSEERWAETQGIKYNKPKSIRYLTRYLEKDFKYYYLTHSITSKGKTEEDIIYKISLRNLSAKDILRIVDMYTS